MRSVRRAGPGTHHGQVPGVRQSIDQATGAGLGGALALTLALTSVRKAYYCTRKVTLEMVYHHWSTVPWILLATSMTTPVFFSILK